MFFMSTASLNFSISYNFCPDIIHFCNKDVDLCILATLNHMDYVTLLYRTVTFEFFLTAEYHLINFGFV